MLTFAGPGKYTDGGELRVRRYLPQGNSQPMVESTAIWDAPCNVSDVESELAVYENLSEETRSFADFVRNYNGSMLSDYIDGIRIPATLRKIPQ